MHAFAITIFLGAFLLFQVQPMLARFILPWFGGTPAVWTTAMLFFQVMLLAGYVYAHLLATHLRPVRQVALHGILLVLSLALLPVTPDADWKPIGHEAPTLRISLLLLVTVGLPYAMLAATAPLIQSWFSHAHPERPAYRLYALSNTGSVLGLLSYPFLVEPAIGLLRQTQLWSVGYGLFVLACVGSGLAMVWRAPHETDRAARADPGASHGAWPGWLVLSATGVVVLLAATNQLCRDVIVIPLLWVVPLTLYLASFILCFGRPDLYRRPVWAAVLMLAIGAVLVLFGQDYTDAEAGVYVQIGIYSLLVFSCCMICHGELYRLRPPPARLTSFYLNISVGGALGGVFVSLIAPLIFAGYWEFHASLLATIVLLAVFALRDPELGADRLSRVFMGAGATAALAVTAVFLGLHIREQQAQTILTHRGFFGILRVYEFEDDDGLDLRSLYHGRIGHGDQYLAPSLQHMPITYYGPRSGIGAAMAVQRARLPDSVPRKGLRVGVVGLGTATVAAYGEAGDSLRFYEIDPAVTGVAREHFSYLANSAAETQIVHGDGRIALERELQAGHPGRFDVLVIDAFSGDAIPVHLLTREALALYREHMAPDAILAFHVSNLFFDLRPVVRAIARDAGLHAAWIEDPGEGFGEDENDWVLVTASDGVFRSLRERASPWPADAAHRAPWTDDFADVMSAVFRH